MRAVIFSPPASHHQFLHKDDVMEWAEICQDAILKELPYKIQTDKWGNIMMSPASNEHGIYQARIITLLGRLLETGTIISECSVQTGEGVKVADIAWASDDFIRENIGQNPFVRAPEICIEILSPSNTVAEMEEKQALYFAEGAQEFWICDRQGNMLFYDCGQNIPYSRIFSAFPDKVALYPQ